MGQRARFFLVLLIVLGLLGLPFIGMPIYAQEDTGSVEPPPPTAPISVALIVDPPIGSPGQMIRVTASISSISDNVESPEILLRFPAQMIVDPNQLPAGTTLNIGANEVGWFPVVAPAGISQISFEFTVAVADVTQPLQSIFASVTHNGTIAQLQTDYWLGILPSATISASPSNAAVGQPLQLIANIVGPGPFVQTWTLGDGRVIEATNPTIVYPATGLYTVTLQLANPLGAIKTTGFVNIAPETIANFTIADDTIAVGQEVTFANLSGGEAPLSYRWDFGDGQSSTEANPTHIYNITGSLFVTLETENAYGTSTAMHQIHIGRAPTADMVLVSPASANAPANFLAFGDETVSQYLWEMGDGSQQTGQEISHTYRSSGEYDVTLIASNEYGSTSVTQRITVGPGTWTIHLPVAMTPGFEAPQPAATTPDSSATELEGAEVPGANGTIPEQLLYYVNEARRLHGLPPVSYNYELTIAAQQHTVDMAINSYTGHTGFDGSTPPERLSRFGYSGIYAGEATAWGFENPIPVVEFWVNSPGHRGMILNPEASEIGIGYTFDPNAPNVWYWTVEFGKRTAEEAESEPGHLVASRPQASSIS